MGNVSALGARAPGPRGMAALVAPFRFQRDPLRYLAGLRRYGPIVRTRAGPHVFHTLFDPRFVRQVLVERAENYWKRGVLDALAPVLGDGLLISEGARWRARRAAAQPAFARKAVAGLLPSIDAEARALVRRWDGALGEIDASQALMRFTLAVVGRALFQVDLGERTEDVSRAVEDVSRCAFARARTLASLPLSWPTPVNRRYRRAIALLDGVVRGLLRDGQPADVFQRLAAVVDPLHGKLLGEEDLRDEAMSLFLAGHETTASTLAWTIDHLGRDRKLQEIVREEVRAQGLEGGLDSDGPGQLPWLEAAISESLRLHPPAWLLMRRAIESDRIGGFEIPAKSFLSVPVCALHRLPEHWSAPEMFQPERFHHGEGQDPCVFMPFGAGPRRCLGEVFARLEMRVVLARILERFELEAVGSPPSAAALATLRPAGPVRLRVRALA